MNHNSRLVGLSVGVALAVAGCTSASTTATPSATPDGTASRADSAGAARSPSAAAPLPVGSAPVSLNPAEFTATITNPYWPMTPGTRWTYREVEEGEAPKSVTVVVTRQTKRIANGITARVVRDTVRQDGTIIEDTFDWYAQDRLGNVWYLGEDTAEFDNGKVSSRGGSFEAGVDGAQPGIAVPGDPRPGLKYRQEYYRGEAEDNGEVLSTAEMVQVPAGKYKGALLTKDTITIEPDVQEFKLYARGVGLVLAVGVSGSSGREELLKVDQAGPTEGTGPLGDPNP